MRISSREVWRDFVTDGVPSSGANYPKKSDIRTWSKWVEDIITAIFSGSGLIYATLANLNADLNHSPNSLAWVIGDNEVANNGIYMKLGLAGAGSWQRVGNLPYSFIFASNIGSGSPSEIQATTSIPVSGDTLILLQIAEDYTGDAATVSFNGAAPLTIKTNSGEDVRRLAAGTVVYGVISGNVFRLASDEAIASLIYEARDDAVTAQAAAQLAQDGAEAARDIAAGYASDAVSQGNVPIYATVAGMPALEIPAGINAIRVNGRNFAGDGEGGLFVDADNGSHKTFESGDGRTWYQAPDRMASYYTASDSLLLSPPASYLVDGRLLPRIYPPNPPPGDYRQYQNAFHTIGANYVDGGAGDTDNPYCVRSTAFGTFNGVAIVAWNRVEAFGHCAMMFGEYVERSAALGSDTFTWAGISSREKAIDTYHNFYANALPNTPAWSDGSVNSPGVTLEAAYPGIGQRIWDYNTFHGSGDAFRFNTGLGRDAGANIVYGRDNTIGGYSAAGYMYAGSGNTIFGTTAMLNSVFATDNVAIGYRAGRDVQDPQRSIFIGKDAGLNVKAADSSIFIGFNAGNGLPGDQDGVLVINNQFTGSINPLISGAFYDAATRPLPGVGINIRPNDIKNASLHVQYGSQLTGILNPNDSAAGILISRGSDTGMTIATPTAGKGAIFFADTESANVGGIMYDHAVDRLYFRASSVYRMQLGALGLWIKDAMKSSNPGSGSKELWYDPSDGNTVKYAV
jgi:hypothetical protein